MGLPPVRLNEGLYPRLYPLTYPSLSFNPTEMMQKARDFADVQALANPFVDKYGLVDYIHNIIFDFNFQSNPQAYLNEWKDKRGGSEEERYPEDAARRFFDQNFKF